MITIIEYIKWRRNATIRHRRLPSIPDGRAHEQQITEEKKKKHEQDTKEVGIKTLRIHKTKRRTGASSQRVTNTLGRRRFLIMKYF